MGVILNNAVLTTLLFGLAMASKRCGITPIPPRTDGGTTPIDARPHSWPWIATICSPDDSGVFSCNSTGLGTIIGSKWILAARRYYFPGATSAVVGLRNVSELSAPGVRTYKTKNVHNYPASETVDASIFELDSDIEFSEHVQPVCLPSSDSVFKKHNHTKTFVAGWNGFYCGKSVFHLREVVQQTQLPVLTVEKKRPFVLFSDDVHPFAMSWGSAMMRPHGKRWFQYGILSWDNNVDPQFYGTGVVFTRVVALCDWIAQVTSGEVRCIDRSLRQRGSFDE